MRHHSGQRDSRHLYGSLDQIRGITWRATATTHARIDHHMNVNRSRQRVCGGTNLVQLRSVMGHQLHISSGERWHQRVHRAERPHSPEDEYRPPEWRTQEIQCLLHTKDCNQRHPGSDERLGHRASPQSVGVGLHNAAADRARANQSRHRRRIAADGGEINIKKAVRMHPCGRVQRLYRPAFDPTMSRSDRCGLVIRTG